MFLNVIKENTSITLASVELAPYESRMNKLWLAMPCAQDHWSSVEILCNIRVKYFEKKKTSKTKKKSKSSAYVEDKYQNVTMININATLLAGYKWISLSCVVGTC